MSFSVRSVATKMLLTANMNSTEPLLLEDNVCFKKNLQIKYIQKYLDRSKAKSLQMSPF